MADLELRSVSKAYGDTLVVSDVSLAVEAGEMIALLGPSGCGKTTTLRMVAGFVEPTSGRILMQGSDITDAKPNHRDMGMVFQSYALFPHMSVERNVAFGLHARKAPASEIPTRVKAALEMVGLAGLANRYPRQLSGGQQQRVALARVLALRPKLLLFDEPLSNLDAKLRVQMRHEIRRLQQEVNITSLFVTHDQEEAMTLADRIAVINNGRLEQIGKPAEIYDRPRTRFVADFIGMSNLIEGRYDGERFVARSGLVMPCPAGEVPQGGAVLSIRPEKMDLGTARPGSPTTGRIERATKLGSLIEYVIRLPSGDRFTVHQQDRAGHERQQTGDEVEVIWRMEDSRVFPG